MTEPTSGTGRNARTVTRRRLLGVGAGLGVTLLAGCTGGESGSTNEGGGDDTTDAGSTGGSTAGTFRLLISDQPVAIDEFDSLDVSFDRARIFPAGEDGEEAGNETEDAETNETAESAETNETESGDVDDSPATNESEGDDAEDVALNESTDGDAETNEGDDAEGSDGDDAEGSDGDGEEAGFSTIDLGGATVDLTQVLGDKAIGVFEGELSAGRYTKIELYASDVEGIVDGETADVKIPSGKLQLTKPFEIAPDEPVSFVFDINVVRKGNDGYNLLPVISESGVAGTDVDVDEISGDGEEADGNGTDTDQSGGGNGTEMADGSDTNDTDTGSPETAESEQ